MSSFLADSPLDGYLNSPWLLGPVVFILWVFLFMAVKRYALKWMQRAAERTAWTWDDVLVRSLSGPLLLPILASGLLILERILPLSPEWDRAFDIVMAGAMALALVLFVDLACRGVLDRLSEKHAVLQGARGLVQGMIRGIIIALGILVFLDSIGISITPILASLGIGSLAVALALKDSLANLFAGIQIILDKAIEPGHFIRLEGGIEGTVTRMSWRTTRIQTAVNSTVLVPNAKLTESLITNFNLPEPEVDVRVEVGVHFDSDLERVEQVTLEVAREIQRLHPEAAEGFEPKVRYERFGESSINLVVVNRARNHNGSAGLRHHLIKSLHLRYAREGIIMPFPTRTLDLPPERSESLRERFIAGGDIPTDAGPGESTE
ncbi:MAG: mechanosensitive ion channel family protein [Acidobacteria bacterium]|nr:mechanosensitive ion channel family protein [Acidobacteriota bacterium]